MEPIQFDRSTTAADNKKLIDLPITVPGSYSMQFLLRNNGIPRKNLFTAVKKAMELFNEAGINVRHHFQKIFVVDETANHTYVDWHLTKRAFDLIMKHCPILKLSAFSIVD